MLLKGILLFVLILFSALLLFILSVHLGARILSDVTLNRSMPKFLSKRGKMLSRVTGSDEFSNFLFEKEKGLKDKKTRDVQIIGHGGVPLMGHILIPDKPKRVIIAVHGWRGSWSRDFGLVSDFWYSSDAAVIYVEQRGQQESGGDYITFGLCERYDVIAWARWAAEKFRGLPIYLCGISMGASSVLMTADLELPYEVRGIIADSGFTSPTDIWSYVVNHNLHLPYNLYKRATGRICRRKIGFSPDDCSTLTALEKCKIPVLFIHGTEDSFVPVEMTYKNFNACNSPKRLFVVPGANHCMCYYLDKQGYENQMSSFWQEYD